MPGYVTEATNAELTEKETKALREAIITMKKTRNMLKKISTRKFANSLKEAEEAIEATSKFLFNHGAALPAEQSDRLDCMEDDLDDEYKFL